METTMRRKQTSQFGIKSISCGLFLTLSAISINTWAIATPQDLRHPLKLDLKQTTVSGLSSGGFMATQFHLSHSDWVQGAGILAAGPYYCAQNSLTTALSDCIGQPKKPVDIDKLNKQAVQWQSGRDIANLKALQDDKVWILGGTLDQKVSSDVVKALQQQYLAWIPESQIHFESNKPFAHHFPTLTQGTDCKKSESPFIGNCGYDAAGEILSHLYTDLKAPKTAQETNFKRLETKVLPDKLGETLGDNAYLYVPESCAQGSSCRLHISFHGCNQNADTIDLQFVSDTGYNRWAESNDIVVLYPQTKNSNMLPFNPQGCWDWWGYTDENYANRQGKQIMAIEAMVKRITGK